MVQALVHPLPTLMPSRTQLAAVAAAADLSPQAARELCYSPAALQARADAYPESEAQVALLAAAAVLKRDTPSVLLIELPLFIAVSADEGTAAGASDPLC